MKRIILMLLILTAGLTASAQYTRPNTSYGNQQYRISLDSVLHFPTACGAPTRLFGVALPRAALYFDSCGHKMYVYDPSTKAFATVTGGGSGSSGISQLGNGYGLVKVNDSTYRVDSSLIATVLRLQNDSAALKALIDVNTAQGMANAAAIQQRIDSLRNNAGVLEARKNNIFVPQFTLPAGNAGTVTNFSKTDGYGIISSVTNPTTTPNHTVTFDSTTVFPAIRATIPAGGGSTNIFDSIRVGATPNIIGTLVNERFNGGALPTGWTQGGGLSVNYSGGKATITGASSIGAPAGGAITTAYASGLQYDLRRMPYEKYDFYMKIVPTTKSAGAVVGLAKGVLGLTVYSQEGIYWDLSNGPNSGRVTFGSNSVPTFATVSDSTSKANFSVGDTLILWAKGNGWGATAGITNLTTNQVTSTQKNQRLSGSGGRWNWIFLNGTYVLTGTKVTIKDRKGGTWFIGDSQTGGYGNTKQSLRFSDLIMQSNYKYFGVWGLPSLSGKYFVDGGLVTELLADVQPTSVVSAFGYNDETENFTAPNTKISIDSIIAPIQRAGKFIGLSGIVPRGSATDIWNDSLKNLAATRGIDFYDIRPSLINSISRFSAAYNYDGIHINDSGAVVIANIITAKSGDSLRLEMSADTNFVQKLYGLPSANAETTVPLVGINNDGSLVVVPNKFPTLEGWVQNKYTLSTDLRLYPQAGRIYMSQEIASDSSIRATNGKFGFHNNTTSNNGNLSFTDAGTPGTGINQAYDAFTGTAAGNIKIIASSPNKTKSAIATTFTTGANNNTIINSTTSASVTGADNLLINAYSNALSSGSNNVLIGPNSGRGLSTASSSVQIITRNTSAATVGNISDLTLIGDASSATGDAYVAGDFAVAPNQYASPPQWWIGGRTMGIPISARLSVAANYGGTNQNGNILNIDASRGVGAAEGGLTYLRFPAPVASGTALQSAFTSTVKAERLGLTVAQTALPVRAYDLILDVQSTNQAVAMPRMTTTQRDLIPTGLLTLSVNAGGTGYTNGNVSLSFTGGGGTGAAGLAVIAGGVVQSIIMTARGSGYTTAPTVSITSGAGTGATFNVTVGATTGATIFCTDCTATDASIGVMQTWNGTSWKNNW